MRAQDFFAHLIYYPNKHPGVVWHSGLQAKKPYCLYLLIGLYGVGRLNGAWDEKEGGDETLAGMGGVAGVAGVGVRGAGGACAGGEGASTSARGVPGGAGEA